MFSKIFLFELRYRMKRPATYIYFSLFFLALFLSYVTGKTGASEKVFHNAPFSTSMNMLVFSFLMLLVVSAVMGVPMYRDLEHGTRNYMYAYPMKERDYFWGRFWGSFVVLLFIASGLVWGIFLGSLLGPVLGIEPADRYGQYPFWDYVRPFLLFVVPNLFISAAIFFSLVSLTKNQRVLYAGGIVMLLAYLITTVLMVDIENRKLVRFYDIFGINLFSLVTRYWTPAERNTLYPQLNGDMLFNRLFFVAISLGLLLFAWLRFKFSTFTIPVGRQKLKQEAPALSMATAMPQAQISFDKPARRKMFWDLVKIEFKNIVRDNYFRVILLAGIAFLIFDFWFGFTNRGVKSRPITTELMDLKNYDFTLFMFIILIFFSGEAIHREKTFKFNVINDALPVSNTKMIMSKLVALIGVALVLATHPIIVGVLFQTIKGHFEYNLPVWFTEMYLFSFPNFIAAILLSFAVHLLVNNKWAAHGITVGIFLVMWGLRAFAEMDFNLFFYFYSPEYRWSDMNGIGHFLKPQLWFNFYWLAAGALMVVLASLFFVRGIPGSFKERLKLAAKRFTPKTAMLSLALLLAFLGAGAYIYYNTNILNSYVSIKEDRERKVEYEKKLKKYQNIPQPYITDVEFYTDIYPADRTIKTHAIWKIVNRSPVAIDTLHLMASNRMQYTLLYNNVPATYITPVVYDNSSLTFFKSTKDTLNYRMYKLPQPMQPGDSAVIDIRAVTAYKGFPNKGYDREIVYNGTFLEYTNVMPAIGYDPGDELSSDKYRVQYGLAKKTDDVPPATDSAGRWNQLFVRNSDFVKFRGTLSTSADQVAISPGYVKKTWEKDGRRYFEFEQDAPIINFFTFLSGRYSILRDKVTQANGNSVNLEVYYHPTHTYNIDRFMASMRDGIKYFSERYGPFQHRQMRIIEFPRYAGFAQSFAGTVPTTEGGGWILDYSDPDKFDGVYWLTAHELAHQWWGHQVTPSYTLGSNMISESLAEFTALQLAEWKYGKDNMQRFLKDELDGYLTGRGRETKFERTLIDANNPYIWYQKGGLSLYALQDLIGEANVVKALREFRDSFAFRSGPYATSHDLYNSLYKYTPDSAKYFLEDSWKRIALYENRITSATAKPLGNDRFEVTMKVFAGKQYADSTGKETKAAMNDYVDIGVFAAETRDKNGRRQSNPLYLRKYRLTGGEHTITVEVKGKPVKAGIDPYNVLIDRIPNDNVMDL